jgi:hypothetical protein
VCTCVTCSIRGHGPLASHLRSEPEEENVASGVVAMGRSGVAVRSVCAGRMPTLRCAQICIDPVAKDRLDYQFFFCPARGVAVSIGGVFVCAAPELEAPGCGLGIGRLMRNFTAPFSLPSEITASNSFGSGLG